MKFEATALIAAASFIFTYCRGYPLMAILSLIIAANTLTWYEFRFRLITAEQKNPI